MKASIFFLLIIVFGCSSDLDIIYDHPTVPVVYAIINSLDTVHYVKVQKTFIINTNNDWSNLSSDSMEFDDVEVFLYGKTGDSLKWVEQFTETTVAKDDGFFPSGNYQIYMLNKPLPIKLSNPNRGYYGSPDIDSLILEVRIHDMDLVTKATAKVLKAGKIIAYKSPNVIYAYGGKPSVFALPSPGESEGSEYSESYRQIKFCIHFKEYYENTQSINHISWSTYKGWDGNVYFITPERLFNRMKLQLQKNDSILSRKLDSIDIEITRPSKFFNYYWSVREYWEDSDRPPYTNFDNSFGMFITIERDKLTGMKLDSQSMDSLCNGYNYKEMKFKNW